MMNIVLDKGDMPFRRSFLLNTGGVTSTAELKQQVMESGVHYDALIEHAQESVLEIQKPGSNLVGVQTTGCATSLLLKIHSSMLKIFTTTEKSMMLKALLLEKFNCGIRFLKKGTYQASTGLENHSTFFHRKVIICSFRNSTGLISAFFPKT